MYCIDSWWVRNREYIKWDLRARGHVWVRLKPDTTLLKPLCLGGPSSWRGLGIQYLREVVAHVAQIVVHQPFKRHRFPIADDTAGVSFRRRNMLDHVGDVTVERHPQIQEIAPTCLTILLRRHPLVLRISQPRKRIREGFANQPLVSIGRGVERWPRIFFFLLHLPAARASATSRSCSAPRRAELTSISERSSSAIVIHVDRINAPPRVATCFSGMSVTTV